MRTSDKKSKNFFFDPTFRTEKTHFSTSSTLSYHIFHQLFLFLLLELGALGGIDLNQTLRNALGGAQIALHFEG